MDTRRTFSLSVTHLLKRLNRKSCISVTARFLSSDSLTDCQGPFTQNHKNLIISMHCGYVFSLNRSCQKWHLH